MENNKPTYLAVVEQVHSGDDLILMVDLGFDSLFKRVRVRLLGVDTPSAYKAKPDTEAGRVRQQVRDLIEKMPVKLEVHSAGKASWVGTIFFCSRSNIKDEGVSLNQILIGMGYVYTPTHPQE